MRSAAIYLLCLSLLSGIFLGGSAVAENSPPAHALAARPALPQKAAKAPRDRKRKPSNYFSRIRQEILAKFRPVDRVETINFTEAEKILRSKTTPLEEIYHPDFEKRVRNEYNSRVTPFEKTANDPYRRAQSWEMARYDNGRRDMADWTAKEAMNERVQQLLRGADKNSAPMRVMSVMHTPDDDKPAPRQAKAGSGSGSGVLQPELQAAKEEPRIPTRLKSNLNPLKQEGQLVLQNPVVTTGVKGSRSEVAVEMKREFRGIGTESNAKYGVKAACLQLNLRQKITDQVSLHLDHSAYTSDKRGPQGEKTREAARVTYSLSF